MDSQSPSTFSSSTSPTFQPNTSTPSTTTINSPASSSIGTVQAASSNKPPLQLIASPTNQRRPRTIIACPKALTLLKELGLGSAFFNSGKMLAWALDPADPDFIRINKYMHRGQRPSPGKWYNGGAKVVGILQVMSKVNSLEKASIPSDFNEDPRNTGQLRKMLWHGTLSENVPGILQNGLVLPKRETGGLGNGIYFADTSDFSLWYCRSGDERHGYMFLCDVLLGNDMFKTSGLVTGPEIRQSKGWFWEPPTILKVDSILGQGRWIPDPQEDIMIDGSLWPLGEGIRDECQIQWIFVRDRNTYVVFNKMQVIPKYLVKVEFTPEPID